jgi:hypothetical protein
MAAHRKLDRRRVDPCADGQLFDDNISKHNVPLDGNGA